MATTLTQLNEQLERVRTQIAAIEESAKEYSIRSGSGAQRSKVNHDLQVLYNREAELERKIGRLQSSGAVGGTTYVADFTGR